MKNWLLPRRRLRALATGAVSITKPGALVLVITTSASSSVPARSFHARGSPPKPSASARTFSGVRPMTSRREPDDWSERAVVSAMSPEPTSRTVRSRRSPKMRRAKSTATLGTDTCPAPIAVPERTRLAARIARESVR